MEVVDKIGLWSIKAWMFLMQNYKSGLNTVSKISRPKQDWKPRKKELDIHMEKGEKKRIPQLIKEIPKKPINKSIRAEKERQGRLFEATSSKELPAMGLWTHGKEPIIQDSLRSHCQPCQNFSSLN